MLRHFNKLQIATVVNQSRKLCVGEKAEQLLKFHIKEQGKTVNFTYVYRYQALVIYKHDWNKSSY